MAFQSRLARFLSACGRTNRFSRLFALSDRDLTARGFDRAGLTRSYLSGLGGH